MCVHFFVRGATTQRLLLSLKQLLYWVSGSLFRGSNTIKYDFNSHLGVSCLCFLRRRSFSAAPFLKRDAMSPSFINIRGSRCSRFKRVFPPDVLSFVHFAPVALYVAVLARFFVQVGLWSRRRTRCGRYHGDQCKGQVNYQDCKTINYGSECLT